MRFIINADDFGLTQDTNRAIKDLVKLKTVSSTTVMANMPYAVEIVDLMVFDQLGIGLHFNLTQGKPITAIEEVGSLVDTNGDFYPYKSFRKRLQSGKIAKKEILLELESQFNMLSSLIGDRVSHMDSHQSTHRLGKLYPVVHHFAREKGIGLRPARRYFIKKDATTVINPLGNGLFSFSGKRFLSEMYYALRDKLLTKKAAMPQGELLADTFKKLDTLELLMNLKNENAEAVFEISCHPAKSLKELDANKTKLLDKRVLEYQLLSSDAFVEYVKMNPLTNFKSLKKQ